MNHQNTPEYARSLDEQDELKDFRSRFFIPQHNNKDSIYLTGNSLGLQPKTVSSHIQQELDDWSSMGVKGHLHARHPWLSYHEMFPKYLSKIVGCKENEVVAMNQLTVNLHLLLISFYRPTKKRYKIICEAKAFPSDQYALQSQIMLHAASAGFDPSLAMIEVSPRTGEHVIRHEDILGAIEEHKTELALVMIGGVNYYTGQVFNMKEITAAAHKAGAYAGFDLAHAAGNISLSLHDWGVDFACWCSYKYLNSGPGGVGGIFINEKHTANNDMLRLAGWWGHSKERRFQMEKEFDPIPGAEGWQLSNAPVLSMAAHKASLEIFDQAGMDRLHKKSALMSDFLRFILKGINLNQEEKNLEVLTPSSKGDYGCQVSMLMLKYSSEIFKNLSKEGIIADWREPNVIRIAPVPLYNTFTDIYNFGAIINAGLNNLKI